MNSTMISILAVSALGLITHQITGQEHQSHGNSMHQNMMEMMGECSMMGDKDMDHSEMMQMMEEHPMFEGEDMSHSEMMQKMREMDHSEKMAFMEDHPMMKNKEMDHTEMMEMIGKCPMMQGEDESDSVDHEDHH